MVKIVDKKKPWKTIKETTLENEVEKIRREERDCESLYLPLAEHICPEFHSRLLQKILEKI